MSERRRQHFASPCCGLADRRAPESSGQLVRGAFTASPDNVGLHAPVEVVDVSGWSRGFWAASPRVTTFALHGFHDNGLWADTDFKILVGLTSGWPGPHRSPSPPPSPSW
ncbi:MAG TPA: hypothetical protein VHM65_10535 [Candidatus Lustribacter sp.]|nr:hypothetical protein [Candidatus Lustribacter sp.]